MIFINLTIDDSSGTIIEEPLQIIIQDTEAPQSVGNISPPNLLYGVPFRFDLNATDPSGIDTWIVDDTANFSVDQDGVLTNASILEVGLYQFTVTVNDTYDNQHDFNLALHVDYAETQLPDLTLLLLIGGGGAAVVAVVLVVYFTRKR